MTHADVEAIVGGHHGDPFRILGPHAIKRDWQADAWEIRAFLPHAKSAEVLVDDTLFPMENLHPEGFFVARLASRPAHYRFRVHTRWDIILEEEDPYRFPPLLTSFQLHLHGEGTHYETYSMLGAHLIEAEGVAGVRFSVWAPNAIGVNVVGDFNGWDARRHPMRLRDGGVWELFVPNVAQGAVYKYFVLSRVHGYKEMKADPYAFATELPPKSGSIVADPSQYRWNDSEWLDYRAHTDWLRRPMAIYEVHLGSWLHTDGHRPLSYRELADKLVRYVRDMGYTHIELLPINEHPFSGSWGYQVTGYFAPTSRFGTPDDFRYFIDCCHQAGLGVILDWVPAHFPKDAHGLAYFDGTAIYEHQDPRKGEHRDWGTNIFNFGRNEVRAFLISSALFWLKEYHIDGLRVDAVASMLYLDYSRPQGDWLPNIYGGNENLEAIEFLKRFNEQAHKVPGAITIAEESTSYPGVSRPVYANGLGFTLKWNMGWMHDMLRYFAMDPIFRKHNQHQLTFSMLYAFSENYVLPISHDEVVHGKASLIGKMSGDDWQRFANVRCFLAFMYAHPGKKLLFMGSELGQYDEWNSESSLRWDLLQFDLHSKLQLFTRELNLFYLRERALWEVDFHWSGFEWLDFNDVDNSVLSFFRWSRDRQEFLLVVCNFTPIVRHNYRLGVPRLGRYREVLNTDSSIFGGSNAGNGGFVDSQPVPDHGRPHSVVLTLPPLAVLILKLDAAPALPESGDAP